MRQYRKERGDGARLSEPPVSILEDLARGIAPRQAGDAAAWVGARAAQIKARNRHPVIGVAVDGPHREELVERKRPVEDVATDEAELALEVERRERAPAEHTRRKSRRHRIDGGNHQ